MMRCYILNGHTPVRAKDIHEYALWVQKRQAAGPGIHVAKNTLADGTLVSTVFLGIDHNFSGSGEPVLFETMVFGGVCDGYEARYETWASAELGHAEALRKARSGGSKVTEYDVSSAYPRELILEVPPCQRTGCFSSSRWFAKDSAAKLKHVCRLCYDELPDSERALYTKGGVR